MISLALTVHQPWAWCIGSGLKLVENRSWLPPWRRIKEGDDLVIHAGSAFPQKADYWAAKVALRALGREKELPSPSGNEFSAQFGLGRVVAVAKFAGVVRSVDELDVAQRPWWQGPYGWLLSDVRQLELGIAPKVVGQQGLWPLPAAVASRLERILEGEEGNLWRRTAP